MYTVKRLGRNGMWNAVSLIDENGSFRGEARFENREEAEDYLRVYMQRMKARLKSGYNDGLQVKVFGDGEAVEEVPKVPQKPKSRSKSRKTGKKRRKRAKTV